MTSETETSIQEFVDRDYPYGFVSPRDADVAPGRRGRDAAALSYVLRRVPRHHRRDRGVRRRCHLDRSIAVEHGAPRHLRRLSLSERDWSRRLGHSFAPY